MCIHGTNRAEQGEVQRIEPQRPVFSNRDFEQSFQVTVVPKHPISSMQATLAQAKNIDLAMS